MLPKEYLYCKYKVRLASVTLSVFNHIIYLLKRDSFVLDTVNHRILLLIFALFLWQNAFELHHFFQICILAEIDFCCLDWQFSINCSKSKAISFDAMQIFDVNKAKRVINHWKINENTSNEKLFAFHLRHCLFTNKSVFIFENSRNENFKTSSSNFCVVKKNIDAVRQNSIGMSCPFLPWELLKFEWLVVNGKINLANNEQMVINSLMCSCAVHRRKFPEISKWWRLQGFSLMSN